MNYNTIDAEIIEEYEDRKRELIAELKEINQLLENLRK
jgi:hypothetical protein